MSVQIHFGRRCIADMRLKVLVKLGKVLVRKFRRQALLRQLALHIDGFGRLDYAPPIEYQLNSGRHLNYSQVLRDPVHAPIDPGSGKDPVTFSNPLLFRLSGFQLRLLGPDYKEIENCENQDR
jgi:hypothetical protein